MRARLRVGRAWIETRSSDAYEQHTSPGDLVVEPFNGSGSQIIAAEKLARRCYAMELQPVFVDGTVDRWQQATGKQATLEATGQTFDEVKEDRLGTASAG